MNLSDALRYGRATALRFHFVFHCSPELDYGAVPQIHFFSGNEVLAAGYRRGGVKAVNGNRKGYKLFAASS